MLKALIENSQPFEKRWSIFHQIFKPRLSAQQNKIWSIIITCTHIQSVVLSYWKHIFVYCTELLLNYISKVLSIYGCGIFLFPLLNMNSLIYQNTFQSCYVTIWMLCKENKILSIAYITMWVLNVRTLANYLVMKLVPPPPTRNMCRRAVRIILECILVSLFFPDIDPVMLLPAHSCWNLGLIVMW